MNCPICQEYHSESFMESHFRAHHPEALAKLRRHHEDNHEGDFAISALIGGLTGNGMLGGVLGGDMAGGFLGQAMSGMFDSSPTPSTPDFSGGGGDFSGGGSSGGFDAGGGGFDAGGGGGGDF